jgi:lipopolysaccharide export system ATP-binding protein
MIVGLTRPDAGASISATSTSTALPMYERARRGIGYLPQEAVRLRKLTVEQNILAILETLDLTAAERAERLRQLLDELGIAKVAKSKALALSGGERRRLEITRALVISPMFMLLDEPFAGIDPIAVVDIQGIVSQLKRRGIGVLITDHNVRETLGICDRAYIVNEGTVLEEGTPTQIADSPRARQIYLGEAFRL